MRLIDADDLHVDYLFLSTTTMTKCYEYVSKAQINNAPTVEAVPVVHGRWIPWKKWNEDFVVCSECKLIGYKNYDAFRPGYASNMNYCPNCGALMTEGAEDD